MKLLFVCNARIKQGQLLCPSWVLGIVRGLDPSYEISMFSVDKGLPVAAQNAAAGERTVQVYGSDTDIATQLTALNPDVIVIFGTEFKKYLRLLQACETSGMLSRTVGFAQGMAFACARHYAEGIPERIIRRYTVRDVLRRRNIRGEIKRMERIAESERSMMEWLPHFIGRTTLDRAAYQDANPQGCYHRCGDLLRPSFYEGAWCYEKCIPHRVFISQFYYPIKGFHYLLEAVASLKKRYPDIRIAAAGYNPILGSLTKRELKDSSYIRYVKSLIRRYGLGDSVELLGLLSEEQMKEEYLKANVFVLPSTIENSPNSLGEAMLLGVPCVAADVGGVSDLADHRREAYLYPSSAVYLLAHYIGAVFDAGAGIETMALAGRRRAKQEYDREINAAALEKAFHEIARR